MRSTEIIRGFKSELANLKAKREIIKSELANKQREYSTLNKSIKNIESKINTFKVTKPTISEHAILRYLERVEGINIEEIKEKILNKDVLNLIDKLGDTGKYPIDDYRIIMKNNVVTTVVK